MSLTKPVVSRPIRYQQLDALRGIAAVVVVIAHMAAFYNDDGKTGLFQTPLSPYVLGQAAVVLFFVLSGFVLTLPSLKENRQPYLSYLIRRICRLYIPFAFAILFALLLYEAIQVVAASPRASAGLAGSWATPLSIRVMLLNLLMLGDAPNEARLDPPIWSLIVEIRASVLFPFLVFAVTRAKWLSLALGVVLALGSSRLKAHLGDPSAVEASSFLGSFLLTFRYIVLFLFGIILARSLNSFVALVRSLPRLFHIVPAFAWSVFTLFVAQEDLVAHGYIDLLYGVFSIYLITLSIASPSLSNFLQQKWCQWLGALSFSLYLIHWPILMAMFFLFTGRVNQTIIQLTAIPFIFLTSFLMELWVERPSHQLGKKISAKFKLVKFSSTPS